MKKNSWPILMLVTFSIFSAACSRAPKSDQAAALDDAYKSGLLTTEEYAAKKTALAATAGPNNDLVAALDRAYQSGVLSKEEYEAKKATLTRQANTTAALDDAYRAGLLTRDEYDAKKAALLGTPVRPQAAAAALPPTAIPAAAPAREAASPQPVPPPSYQPSAPPPSTDAAPRQIAPEDRLVAVAAPPTAPAQVRGNYLRLRMAKLVDQSGFERPMTSASLLIPADWQMQGGTQWVKGDACNTVQTSFHTAGPDGRAVELLPTQNWTWSDDQTTVKLQQQNVMQQRQYGQKACDVMPPMRAADYLRRIIPRLRPNAQLVAMDPMPQLLQQLQQGARQTEQQAAQYNLRQRVTPDVARARIRYTTNGQAFEEWVVGVTYTTGTLSPTMNINTMQQGQAFSYNCAGAVSMMRAPQGQLESSEKLFMLMFNTYRVDPAWQARVSGHQAKMGEIAIQGARDRSAINTKLGEDLSNIRRGAWENQQRSEDHVFRQQSESTRGVDTYRNPVNGETVELSNQYGHAWVNNRGEYLLSDQQGFDPAVTLHEDWKAMQIVKP